MLCQVLVLRRHYLLTANGLLLQAQKAVERGEAVISETLEVMHYLNDEPQHLSSFGAYFQDSGYITLFRRAFGIYLAGNPEDASLDLSQLPCTVDKKVNARLATYALFESFKALPSLDQTFVGHERQICTASKVSII